MESISIQSLPRLSSYYSYIGVIGKGGTSIIQLWKSRIGREYAVKIPYTDTINMVIHEANEMSKISKYPNQSPFITYYGLYEYNNLPVMVSDYFPGKQLDKLGILNEVMVRSIAKQIFYQLNYLHKRNILHSDIGPQNIMINNKGEIKTIDIGNYRELYPSNVESIQGLQSVYRTNKDILKRIYNSGSYDVFILGAAKDVYDSGELLATLLGYQPLTEKQINDNVILKVTLNDKVLENVINACLNIDPYLRPTTESILKVFETDIIL